MRQNNIVEVSTRSIAIVIVLLVISCKTPRKKIIAKFPNGATGILYYYPDKNDTSSFIATEYYSNGNIRKTDTVQSGKLVGNLMQYYPNGKISTITTVTNSPKAYADEVNGTETDFYDNGKILGQLTIKNGQLNGLCKFYNVNGVLTKEYYLKDSIKNGDYKEFYENGKTSFQTTYLNGLPTGIEYYFKENGDTLKYLTVNENGEGSLPYKRWLDNGTILKGDFIDTTEKAATWIWFSKDGKELKRKIERSTNKTFVSPEPN